MKTAIVAGQIGGQTALQPEFHNFPGYLDVDGYKLIQNMKTQVSRLDVDLIEPWFVEKIVLQKTGGRETFAVVNPENGKLESRSILIATGGKPKYLNVPGEREYANKGVTYCATCDAPLFAGKRTVAVGGGNTGAEAALLLTQYATKVYLLHRRDELKADEVTKEQIKAARDRIELVYNALTTEILGRDGKVSGLSYTDSVSGESKELAVDGVFIAIGFLPNSGLASGLAEINALGEIVVDPRTNMTSHAGIFAAGDVTDIPYKQTVIAAGEAAKAVLAIYQWLLNQKTH